MRDSLSTTIHVHPSCFAYFSYGMRRTYVSVKKNMNVPTAKTTTPAECMLLVHLADKLVDVVFPITKVTTLHVVLELPCPPSTGGVRELEWPEEVGGLLEVGAGGDDLVYEVLDAKNVELAERALNDAVVGERDALLVDFSISALVDQLTNCLQVGFTIENVRSSTF